MSPVDFRARMVGGKSSEKGWWPWHIGLYKRDFFQGNGLKWLSCHYIKSMKNQLSDNNFVIVLFLMFPQSKIHIVWERTLGLESQSILPSKVFLLLWVSVYLPRSVFSLFLASGDVLLFPRALRLIKLTVSYNWVLVVMFFQMPAKGCQHALQNLRLVL